MKKNWILGMAVCGILSVSDSAYGQSIKDILNSAAVKDAVTTVTGGKKLTVEKLAGTWTYVNPAIQLEGDNALKNVAASVASSEMEKKLKDYLVHMYMMPVHIMLQKIFFLVKKLIFTI